MLTHRRLAFAFSVMFLLAGCGKPAMVPVRGQVTYRGHPTNNGLVVLTPDGRGSMAIGRIREDGAFAVYTGDLPGAYPGKYRITVSSLAPGASSESWGRFEFPRSAIPDKFRDANQSTLVCTIEPKEGRMLDIDLTD